MQEVLQKLCTVKGLDRISRFFFMASPNCTEEWSCEGLKYVGRETYERETMVESVFASPNCTEEWSCEGLKYVGRETYERETMVES